LTTIERLGSSNKNRLMKDVNSQIEKQVELNLTNDSTRIKPRMSEL
jgi:antitoxin component of MazEF toxin-antitoxin module